MVLDEEYFAAAGIADNVAGEDEYVQALAQFNGIAHSKLQEWMEKHADTIDFLSSNYTDAITEVIQDTWDAFINNDFYGMKVFGREVKGIDDIGDFLDRGYTQGFKDGEKTVGFNVPGGFSLIDKQAMEYIKDYNFELIQRIPDDIRLGIKGSIFKGMAIGEDNQLIKNRIRNFITEPFPVYRRKDLALVEKGILKISDIKPIRIIQPEFRSNMIARTEMMRAYNQGNKSAMLGTGQDTVLIPHVPNECRFCAMFAGQVYKLNSTDCPYLPFHPHCRHYYQPQVDVEKLKNDLRELQGFQDTTGVSPYDAAMDTLGNIPPGQKKLIDDTTNALPDHLRLNKFVDEGLIESVPGSGVEFVDSRYFKIGRDLKGEDLQREYLKNYAKNIFPRYKKDWDFEGFTPEQFYDIFSKYALDPMNVDARYYRDWMSEHVFRDGFSLKYAKELAEKEANDFWDWSGKPGLIENAMYDRYHYDYRILENKYSDLNRMINNYQYGGYYEVINKDLRAGRLPGTWEASDFSEEILFLDKVLDDNNIQGLPHAFTLYRGVENPGVFKGYKVGDVFQDPGFTSTSFEKDIMESFGDWKLTILAPSGTKGLYLEEFTLEGSPTWEWLLPRGTHFKIIQRDDATKSLLLKITDEPVTKLKAPEIPIFKKELPGAHGENAPIKFKAEDGNIWWAKQVGSATAAREMYGQTLAKEYGLKTYDEMLNKSVPFVDDKGLKKALKNNYAEGSNILYTKDIPDALTFREALDLSSRDVMLEEFHDDAMKIFVYDVLTGNTDRHLGNIMVKNDGLYSIDYGYVGNRMQFLNHLEPDILKYKTTKTDFDSWFSKTFDKYLREFDKINLEDLPKAKAFGDEGSLTDVVKLNRENFKEKILSEIERHDWFQFKVPDGVKIKTELTDDELADFVRWWDRLPNNRLRETISIERMYGDFPEFDNATGILKYTAPDKFTTLTKGEKVFRDYLATNIWTKYGAHVFESGNDFAKAYEKHLLGQTINDKEVRELFKNVDKAVVKVDFPKGVVDSKEMRMPLHDIGDFNYQWKEKFGKVVPEWELRGSYEDNLNEMGKYLYDIYKSPFDNAEQMGKALDEYIQHYIIADSENIKYFDNLFEGNIEKIPKGPKIESSFKLPDRFYDTINKLPQEFQKEIKIINDVEWGQEYYKNGILHVNWVNKDVGGVPSIDYIQQLIAKNYDPGPFGTSISFARAIDQYVSSGEIAMFGQKASDDQISYVKKLLDGKLTKRPMLERQTVVDAQRWADDVFDYTKVDREVGGATQLYKGEKYYEVNEQLRNKLTKFTGDAEDIIPKLDEGFMTKEAKSPYDMVLYRGASDRLGLEKKRIGDIFNEPAFVSTSLSKDVGAGFAKPYEGKGWNLEIHAPKGTPMFQVEKLLKDGKWNLSSAAEAEVLLDRNLQFKILTKDINSRTAILEVVGQLDKVPSGPKIVTDMDVDLGILNKLPKEMQRDIKIVNDIDDIDLITGYVKGGVLHVPDIAETNRVLDNYLYHFVTLKYEPGPFGSADRMAQGLRTYLQRGKVTSVGGLPRSKEFQDHIKKLLDGKLTKRTAIESQGWYEAQKWADNVFEYKHKAITSDVAEAIGDYKQHAYKATNKQLRDGGELSFETKAIVKKIDTGMTKSDMGIVVWRATSPKERFDLKKVGDVFDDKAYASTSLSKNTALGFVSDTKSKGYMAEIRIPKGTGMVQVEKMLVDNGLEIPYQEAEILLDRGLQYKILKLDHKNKTVIIEVVGKHVPEPKFPVANKVLYTDPESLTSPVKFATKDGEEYWAKALKPYDAAFEDAGYKIGQKMGIEGYPSVEVVKWNDYPDGPLKKEIETNWKNQFNKVKSDRYSDIVITKNIDHAEEFDDYFDFTYQGTKKEWFKEHDIEVKQNILLNFLIGECDAHSRNVVFDADGIMHVIDHGMAGRKLDERFVDDVLAKHWFKYNKVPKSQWDTVWKKEFSFWSKQFDDPKLLDGLDPQAAKFIKENQGNIKKRISEWMDKEQRWAPEPGPKIETEALKTEPMKEVREIKTKNIELSTEETNILQKMMGDLPEKYRPSSSDVLIRSFGKEPYEGRDGSGGVFGGMQLLIAEKTIDEDKLDNIIKAYGQAIRTQHKITSNELFDESFANYVLHQELLSKKVIKVYDNFFKSGKFNDNILKGIEKVELIKPQITPLNPKPKIKKVVEKVGNYKTINSSTGSDWISGIFSKQYDKVVSKDKKFAEHLETAKSHTDSLNVHFNKGGKVKDLDNVESLMQKTLDSAINNFKMPDNTIVYRGLKTKYVDPKLKTGDIFAPNCYSYTTLNKKWAEGFAGDEGYTVRYLLPKGTNAFSFDLIYTLGGMEVPYRLEQEFLLAREQAFKVLNVNHNTKEMTVVAVNVKKT